MSVIKELLEFYNSFSSDKGVFGKSYFGKDLYYFKVAKTAYPKVICQYSIHAREYITTYLALEQIKIFERVGRVGTVYFLPMLNPDGVNICLNENPLHKANGRGVDLNVNFPARWGKGEKNVKKSGSENYIGAYPLSEPESKSLANFTLDISPHSTISYHSKGEEIYYEFNQPKTNLNRDRALALLLAKSTGYAIKSTPNSTGGYKDWCIEKLKIPAFTIEVGSDKLTHPIRKQSLTKIKKQNEKVVQILTENL